MGDGELRFIADSMLGRLATWLRILGYDTLYFRDADDGRLVTLARREGRILLTRDTRLLARRRLGPVLFIRHDRVWDQLRQVAGAFALRMGPQLGSRCLRCNRRLALLAKACAAGRVPEYVYRHHDAFFHCEGCGRIFWGGTHLSHMEETVRALCG
ncbi:MAG TPA: Mut7-C RNAse domain-containing protein [Candidatus Methylomirabilis sp.]|nr:Mut7-C RNAse domain-containing protein [Candidatus Methylomirabilis sp.]